MNLKHHLPKCFEEKYLLLQTFAFLCGSLLTLVYIPHKSAALAPYAAALLYAGIFMLLAACLSSVCAGVLLPILTALFGAASAFTSLLICEGSADKIACIWLGALLAAATPLHFLFTSFGLSFADKVRQALRKDAVLCRADYVFVYLAVVSAALLSGLIAAAAVFYIK